MKTLLSTFMLFLILFALPAVLQAQNFEGVVTYRYKFKDRTGYWKPKEVKRLRGTQQKIYIKGDKYKKLFNGTSQKAQTYKNDTIYETDKTVRAIKWISTSKPTGKVKSHKITKNAAVINGIKCHLLTVKTTEGHIDYYYNPSYKLDDAAYSNHNYDYWAFCLEMTEGALPIKCVFDNKENYTEITCTSLEAMAISESIFDLPNDVPLIRKPRRMR